MATRYATTHSAEGNVAANLWLADLRDTFSTTTLELAASDRDIVDAAEVRAKAVQRILGDQGTTTAEGLRVRLERYARAHGVRTPQAKALAGLVRRMTSAAWWRRALRREIVREVERQAVRLGLVHRRSSIYASTEAVRRRTDQKARIARYLEATEAVNTSGQSFTLAELASKNVSNPRVRRVELMVRMRGFEEFAADAGHVGMFYTWTCPSRMHAVLSATCQPNPHYDGTTPRQAQEYLVHQWAKCRAALDRKQVHAYGVRVAEPHHDATPHWHLLLFMPRALAPFVTSTLRKYASQSDAAELASEAAARARFHAVSIDRERGSATGYIAKYVAKNIDATGIDADHEGEEGTASAEVNVSNVEAWATTWGIRQFQQIGGPGITVWRELRRLRAAPQLELFDRFWEAADTHTWRDFVGLMGGNAIRRRDRAIQLWRVEHDQQNSYGEDAPPKLEGVRHVVLEHCRTRFEAWEVRRANKGRDSGRAANAHAGPERIGGGTAARRSEERGNARHHAEGRGGAEIGQVGAGDRAGVLAPSGGVAVGFGVPWTRVNNCTPDDLAADFRRSVQQIGAPP